MRHLEPFLKRAEKARNDEAGQALLEEIAALGEAVIPEIVEALQIEDYNWLFPAVLAKLGKASSPALLELFFDPYLTQPIFEAIVNAMLKVKDEKFIGSLLPLIYSHDDKRADAAVEVLEHVNDERVTNVLAAILGDKSSNRKLQTRALKLIGFCPSASHTIPLIRTFTKDKPLKYLAILSLYSLGDELELKTIRRFLEDKWPEHLKYRFLWVIARKHDKRLYPFWLELLNEITKKPRRGKRDSALLDALIYLAGELKLEEAVNALATCLEYNGTYREASEALMKIGNDAALELLLDKIRLWWDRNIGWEKVGDNEYESRLLVDAFGSRLFEPLVKFYEKHKGSYLREIAVEILSHLEDPRVTDFFLNISTSPEGLKLIRRFNYNLRSSQDKRLIELATKLDSENKLMYQTSIEVKGSPQISVESEEEIENIYELWQKAEDEKSKDAYFNLLAKLKDERIIPELERLLYSHTEAKNPKAAWSTAWKLSEYPQEKTGKILSDWFKAVPPDDYTREWFMRSIDVPELWEFRERTGDETRLYWLIDALYSPNLRVVQSAIEWLPIAHDKQRMIPLLLPLLHDKRRIPNYNQRICDAAAHKLKKYNIPLAREIDEEWSRLNESGYFDTFIVRIKKRLSAKNRLF
jgi:HEAT repeat protein